MSKLTVLQYPAFGLLLINRFASISATFMMSVTIGWQVYNVARQNHSIEESSFYLGLVGLVQFLPMFMLTLVAGESADRYDRRKILLCVSILLLITTFIFMAISWNGHPSLTLLIAFSGLFGVVRAFSRPASTALATTLVPPHKAARAVSLGTLVFQASMILGPWVGGWACAHSVLLSYSISAGFFLIAMLSCATLALMKLDIMHTGNRGSRMAMIKEGLVYIWTNKIVLGATSLDLFAVLLGGVTALLPVFARDVLHIDADGFGILRSGEALGGGLMTILLAIKPIKRHTGKWMLIAVSVFGFSTIMFAFSSWLWLSVLWLAIMGAADSISVYVRESLVQIVTPNNMRGRVSAVSGLFVSASNELGEFESGMASRLLGPIGAAVFGGVGSMIVTGTWAKIFPALRKADRLVAPELAD